MQRRPQMCQDIESKISRMKSQIRSKHIEQYKMKIRLGYRDPIICAHNLGNNQNSPLLYPDLQQPFTPNMAYSSSSIVSKSSAAKIKEDDELQSVKLTLANLQDCFMQETQKESSHNFDSRLKEQIVQGYDILLHQLIELEDSCRENPQYLQKQQKILSAIEELCAVGIHIWTAEQRSIFSYYFRSFAKNLNNFYLNAQGGYKSLSLVLNYLEKVIRVDETHRNMQRPNNSLAYNFDFNLIEEQILQKLTETLLMQIELEDLAGEINQSLAQKFQKSSRAHKTEYDLINWLRRLIIMQITYYNLYLDEQNYKILIGDMFSDNDQEIGNVNLSVTKATLKTSIEMLACSYQAIRDSWQKWGREENTFVVLKQIYNQIQEDINNISLLFGCLCDVIKCISQDQLRTLQNQTSDGMFQTILGLLFVFAETLMQLTEFLQENQQQENASRGREEQLSYAPIWFNKINNTKIVACFEALISKRFYTQECVYELYSLHNLPKYLLTCIFTEPQQQNCQNSSYERYRKSQLHINSKLELEIQCIKTISSFLCCNGIKVDSEDNLKIRYLHKIGDGSPNELFFQSLSKNKRFVL